MFILEYLLIGLVICYLALTIFHFVDLTPQQNGMNHATTTRYAHMVNVLFLLISALFWDGLRLVAFEQSTITTIYSFIKDFLIF